MAMHNCFRLDENSNSTSAGELTGNLTEDLPGSTEFGTNCEALQFLALYIAVFGCLRMIMEVRLLLLVLYTDSYGDTFCFTTKRLPLRR